METGETARSCAHREALEEVGVDCTTDITERPPEMYSEAVRRYYNGGGSSASERRAASGKGGGGEGEGEGGLESDNHDQDVPRVEHDDDGDDGDSSSSSSSSSSSRKSNRESGPLEYGIDKTHVLSTIEKKKGVQKRVKIFVVAGLPETFPLVTRTKKEVSEIR